MPGLGQSQPFHIITTKITVVEAVNRAVLAALAETQRKVGCPVEIAAIVPTVDNAYDVHLRLCGSAYPEPAPP